MTHLLDTPHQFRHVSLAQTLDLLDDHLVPRPPYPDTQTHPEDLKQALGALQTGRRLSDRSERWFRQSGQREGMMRRWQGKREEESVKPLPASTLVGSSFPTRRSSHKLFIFNTQFSPGPPGLPLTGALLKCVASLLSSVGSLRPAMKNLTLLTRTIRAISEYTSAAIVLYTYLHQDLPI